MIAIIDGDNLMHAAFFVTKDAPSNKRVIRTVRLFTSMVDNITTELDIKKSYIAWDTEDGKNWRKEILPEYKANRQPKDPKYARCVEKAFANITKNQFNIRMPGAEGDDIIFALCNVIKQHKVIISSDHDFIQIIQNGDAYAVYDQKAHKYMEIPKISIIIEKAICGDKSDNLKGVPGYGPKSVEKVVQSGFKLFNENEYEIFRKHVKVIGLTNNPNKKAIYDFVHKYVYAMDVGF